MRRVPIRFRVAAAFAIAMAAVLAAFGWFLYARLDSQLGAALERDLRLRSQDLSALVRRPGGSLEAATGAPPIERGERYAQLLDLQGHVVDATRFVRRRPLIGADELRRARGTAFFTDRPTVPGLDEPSRLLATGIDVRGRKLVLVVGATLEDRAETLADLRTELLIAGPIALGLATLAGYLLAGLSLRPVESMRRRAAVISGDNLGGRLPVPRTHDEIERLGKTLNAMLGRLEDVLRRERDFVADAGHELRTPLALLRTELELALRHGGSVEDLKEAIRAASVEVERLAQLADGLLLSARAEDGRVPLQRERIDVSELFAQVAERFSWRAAEVGRELAVDAPEGVVVYADRVRTEQALGNLVDNALRHGDGVVRLSAIQVDGSVELHVADEGSGFPPQFVERAFERFTRPDGARSGRGSGLGLSIVRVVAESHGGSAHIGERENGADVWLALPLAT